jgi:hypothetical protein
VTSKGKDDKIRMGGEKARRAEKIQGQEGDLRHQASGKKRRERR